MTFETVRMVDRPERPHFDGSHDALVIMHDHRFMHWGIVCDGCQRVTRHSMTCNNPDCDAGPETALPLYLLEKREVPDERQRPQRRTTRTSR